MIVLQMSNFRKINTKKRRHNCEIDNGVITTSLRETDKSIKHPVISAPDRFAPLIDGARQSENRFFFKKFSFFDDKL